MSDSSVTLKNLLSSIGIGVVLQFGSATLSKRMNPSASSVAIVATPVAATGAALQADRVSPPASKQIQSKLGASYSFVNTLIDSFGWARSGMERIGATPPSSSPQKQVASMMTEFRLADMDLRRAAQAVDSFRADPDQSIRVAADGAYLTYIEQIGLNDKMVGFLRALLDDPTGKATSAGSVAEFMANQTVQRTENWRTLSMVVAPATTYVLVDPTFGADKKLTGRLRVTNNERKNLLAALERTFGPAVKAGLKAGSNHFDATGALIYQFLGDTKWKSRDEP